MSLTAEERTARIAVARAHGTASAAAWFSISRISMGNWLKSQGVSRPPHRPTPADLARRVWRSTCQCPMCREIAENGVPQRMIALFDASVVQEQRVLKVPSFPWARLGRCLGRTALFFGPIGESEDDRDRREARAKRICDTCPVRDTCRQHALAHREIHGIWGGLTESERKAVPRSIAV